MKKIVGFIQIVFGAVIGLISYANLYWLNPAGYTPNGSGIPLYVYEISHHLVSLKWIVLGLAILFILQGIVNIKSKGD